MSHSLDRRMDFDDALANKRVQAELRSHLAEASSPKQALIQFLKKGQTLLLDTLLD